MFISNLISYMKGYLVIRVAGRYPERFLNVCSARGILVWDVVRLSDRTLRCKISMRAFKMLPSITSKTGTRVKIISKRGFPILMRKYRKRKWFVGGIFLFLIVMITLNQFVWEIEINGNEKIPSYLIMEHLSSCGLKIGSLRYRIDEKEIKNEMLIKMPELSWIWPNKNGSKIVVEVKEKNLPPEIFDPNDYCNIIARKDGIVQSMLVRRGKEVVKLGDTVQAGETLVSGMMDSERNVEPRFVQADAEVYARVWYEKTRAFSLLHTHKTETGNATKKITLKVFGHNIPLYWGSDVKFNHCTQEDNITEWNVFGQYTGITITTNIYKEINLTEERMSEESTIDVGIREVTAEIDGMTLPNSQLVNTHTTYNVIDEDTIEVTVIAEYIENIAQKVKGY